MSKGRVNDNPGWGHVCVNRQNERSRWNHMRLIVNDGFGAEVNPKWNFKKNIFPSKTNNGEKAYMKMRRKRKLKRRRR